MREPGTPTSTLQDLASLRALLVRHHPAAHAWSEHAHRDHARHLAGSRRERRPELDRSELVRRREARPGRRAAPFRLSVEVVPEAGVNGWIPSPAEVVVSESLLHDVAAAQAFFEPLVASLAR
ncbi:hypothetical protein NUM3379_01820 [Kineococcus sp. NUM-3379]